LFHERALFDTTNGKEILSMNSAETFTISQAAQLCEIELDEIKSWLKSWLADGLGSPSGVGSLRRLTFREVVAVELARQLRPFGVSSKVVKSVAKHVRTRAGLSLHAPFAADVVLVASATRVYELPAAAPIGHLLLDEKGHRIAVAILPLSQPVATLQKRVIELLRTLPAPVHGPVAQHTNLQKEAFKKRLQRRTKAA
jgi:hypothetical protein